MTEKRRLMQNKIKNALIKNEYLQKEEIKLVKDIQTNLEKYKTEKEKIIRVILVLKKMTMIKVIRVKKIL